MTKHLINSTYDQGNHNGESSREIKEYNIDKLRNR